MRWDKTVKTAAIGAVAGALGLSAFLAGPGSEAQEQEKFKVFLSMSWIGNDWQTAAMNMITALAQHRNYRDYVDFSVQASGDNAQKQIQQINAMVQAGADAIIVYPISPTALNQVIKRACDKGVVIMTYDSYVEEPCAHHVGIDAVQAGYERAKWLFTELGGKGNVVEITGVSGTTFDSRINDGTAKALAEFPDIEIIASANGQWSQPEARVQMTKILATHSWDEIDGLLVQTGCYTITQMQLESGVAPENLKPCGGEAANGHRVQMLPADSGVPGAVGLRSHSSGSAVYGGAVAFKMAMEKLLHGTEPPKLTYVSHGPVTNDTVKLCETGTFEEIKAGCNTINPAIMGNPLYYSDVFNPELLPELGLNAALYSLPEEPDE
jgi:ribose transport system substrate-binding protein